MSITHLRISVLIFVHILILAHVFIWGSGTVGSVDFQEFFHAFLKHGTINAGVVLVLLAFGTTLILGRFFCGWACHFGAIQELSWWVLEKFNIKPKTVDSKLVTLLPIIILLNFYVIPNVWYASTHPWELSIKLNEPEIWAFLPGWIIGGLTFLVDGFLIVYFLGKKGFCRFLCPWGAFLKLPNSLAMFKVRKTGDCTHCHECTTHCPIGIDVSYEINAYNKVTNTNCTSCLMCTSGCPENAISYQFLSPMKEEVNLSQYQKQKQYVHHHISNLFSSIRSQDMGFLLLSILFGVMIDGLYGMGHFLSYGIAIIGAYFVISPSNIKLGLKRIFTGCIIASFLFHGMIKFSIWQGVESFEQGKFQQGIPNLKRVVTWYPKPIGRFHLMLAEMYIAQGDSERALFHAQQAQDINPHHEGPDLLLQKIKELK